MRSQSCNCKDKHTGGVQAGPPKPPTPPPGPPPLAHAVGGTSAALAMPLDTAPVVAKWGAGQFGWGWQVAWQAACDFITYTCPMHPTCQATPQNKRNASATISEHVHVLKSTPSHKWHAKWGTLLYVAVGAAMACCGGYNDMCCEGCHGTCCGGGHGMFCGGYHGMCVCVLWGQLWHVLWGRPWHVCVHVCDCVVVVWWWW